MIYLACPYSDPDDDVQEQRFIAVNKVAANLMNAGHLVFSPISHCHPIARAGGLPTDWEFWEKYDRAMIEYCDEMYVLKLPGWSKSTGVAAERKIAAEFHIPIKFIGENK